MSINSDAADILESAAFVIGTGHHTKRRFAAPGDVYSPTSCKWCALGAMIAAEDALASPVDAFREAEIALTAEIGSIPLWNDAPERTPAEVEAAMLKAAAKLLGEA